MDFFNTFEMIKACFVKGACSDEEGKIFLKLFESFAKLSNKKCSF